MNAVGKVHHPVIIVFPSPYRIANQAVISTQNLSKILWISYNPPREF
jgi:hypothetical protein